MIVRYRHLKAVTASSGALVVLFYCVYLLHTFQLSAMPLRPFGVPMIDRVVQPRGHFVLSEHSFGVPMIDRVVQQEVVEIILSPSFAIPTIDRVVHPTDHFDLSAVLGWWQLFPPSTFCWGTFCPPPLLQVFILITWRSFFRTYIKHTYKGVTNRYAVFVHSFVVNIRGVRAFLFVCDYLHQNG